MPPEDDDFLKRYRGPGVSPAWQVFALVASGAAFLLFIVALGLGAAWAFERDLGWNSNRTFQPVAVAVPPNAPVGWNPNGDEPPNPPYPLEADLRTNPGAPVAAEAAPDRKTVRDRFLALGQAVWGPAEGLSPQYLTISPDGQNVAFAYAEQLHVGPLDGVAIPVDDDGVRGRPGGRGFRGPPGAIPVEMRIVGRPAWSADGQHLYFSDGQGSLRRYHLANFDIESLRLPGECPIPVGAKKLIYRRLRPKTKTDLTFNTAKADPSEIVLVDLETRDVRVLLPEGPSDVEPLAVSPDGRHLLVQTREPDQDRDAVLRYRLHLGDLRGEGAVTLKPVGVVHHGVGSVAWSRKDNAFLFSLVPLVSPPDRWEVDGPTNGGVELYQFDVATEKLTRLSRGGALVTFAGTAADDVYLFVSQPVPPIWARKLRRVPLEALQKFAAAEPDRAPRDAKVWGDLFDRVLEEHSVPANVQGDALNPEVLARLAESFAALHRKRFESDPPADMDGWDRLMTELSTVSGPQRGRAGVVLGAAMGEYLRRIHGAVWRIGAGPLMPVQALPTSPNEESPFVLTVNPFQSAREPFGDGDEEDEEGFVPALWLRDLIRRAEGRTILLGNSPAELRKGTIALTDPDLARAGELFKQKKANDGEQLLLDLIKRPKHAANHVLKLHVAKVLCDEGRGKAVLALLDRPAGAERPAGPGPDARTHNLLGLAFLETNQKEAIQQFHTALRYDLYFGPAYLNLAMAYSRSNDSWSATLCLRRYLKLQPYGPYAADARHRLARLQEGEQAGPPGVAPGIP